MIWISWWFCWSSTKESFGLTINRKSKSLQAQQSVEELTEESLPTFYHQIKLCWSSSKEELCHDIREIEILSTEDTQFDIVSIIFIFSYLSTQGDIMRNLKPENFMVDMQGY